MKQDDLKASIKKQLVDSLKQDAIEPPPWKLQAVKLAIGFLAVEAKLEESEYGGFFDGSGDGDSGSLQEARPKPATRGRKRKSDEPADLLSGDEGSEASH